MSLGNINDWVHANWPYTKQVAGPANDDLFAGTEWEVASDYGSGGPARLEVLYPSDLLEVLSTTEDLWMRIKRHSTLHLHITKDVELDTHLILIRPKKTELNGEAGELLQAVQDKNTYAWMQLQDAQGYAMSQPHNLVRDISWAGEVLVIELTPMKRLIRQCGLDVEWQLQGLLNRVQTQSLTSVPAVHQRAEPQQTERWQTIMRNLKQEMDALDV